MSIIGNISLLSNAMQAFQLGLNTTSNNIANAATPGYSRQVLGLSELPVTYDGNHAYGSGVTASSIQRVRDIFLDSRIKFELSLLGAATAKQEALTELAAIFPEVATASATNGLKGAIDNVVAAWTALDANPTGITEKTQVSTSLKALADMLQVDARKTFDLQQRVDNDVNSTIVDINSLVDQIASLNKQIKALPGGGLTGAPNALLDMREQAAEKLAKLMDVDFRITGDGSLSVSFGTGTLVQGGTGLHLIAIPSSTDPGRTSIGYTSVQGAAARDITASIHGGKLGGLLEVRDGEIERARLDLNRIAYGIISRSNEINRTYVAGDGTSSHDLLVGTSAADIMINPIVAATPDYVGGTRDALAPGDLAQMQSELENFIQYSSVRTAPFSSLGGGFTVDPTQALSTQTFFSALVPTTPVSQGELIISTGGNSIPVYWDQTMSINDIIRAINSAGAGAFYATFDNAAQKFILVGSTPMTVYDQTANLGEVLMLSSVVTSSAPINNYPVPGSNQVDPVGALNNTQNLLDLFTTAVSTGGTVLIDGTPINWTVADDIQVTLALNINAATPSPAKVSLSWDSTTQTLSLIKSGDPTQNPGALNFSLGNTLTAIQIVDQKGNLTRTLNLDTNTNASHILDELLVTVGSSKDAETALTQQAQALVDQTQSLQDAQTSVDLNAELAQARLYQRSYEAAVRMQYILDDIMNTLINHVGSSASGQTVI